MLYRVAEFRKSLATPDGNILVAAVHGPSNSRKRKRSQVAVALDRESVNIYDVRPFKEKIYGIIADPLVRFVLRRF